MLIWAVVNVVLSLLALGFAGLNKSAPHRLRFHVCFIALLCWLVPWAQVPQVLPNLLSLDLARVEQRLIAQSSAVTQIPVIIVDTRDVPLAKDFTVLNVSLLLVATLILTGIALFACKLVRHQLRLRLLKRGARNGSDHWQACGIETSVPLLLQKNISGAFYSGFFTPVIWVHDDLAASEELPTLLRHELTHIAQHDNWYLLAITLVEKLLWWNPLAWYLGRRARDLQELSCDERCQAANADYAVELAALMLSNLGVSRSVAIEPLLLSANIFNKTNLDIQRLKVLQRTYQMKLRHIVSAVATAVLAIATVAVATAQPEADKSSSTQTFELRASKVLLTKGKDGERGVLMLGDDVDEAYGIDEGQFQKRAIDLLSGKGEADQFVLMSKNNHDQFVTFKFNSVPLPFVLEALAGMLGDPVALHMPGANELVQLRQGKVMMKHAAGSGEGEVTIEADKKVNAFYVQGAHEFNIPFSSKVKIEDDSAQARIVSVSVENASLQVAIARVAEASHCNIFKDKDTLVVDWCKPD